jgi:hypothetical protein
VVFVLGSRVEGVESRRHDGTLCVDNPMVANTRKR